MEGQKSSGRRAGGRRLRGVWGRVLPLEGSGAEAVNLGRKGHQSGPAGGFHFPSSTQQSQPAWRCALQGWLD